MSVRLLPQEDELDTSYFANKPISRKSMAEDLVLARGPGAGVGGASGLGPSTQRILADGQDALALVRRARSALVCVVGPQPTL